MLPHLSSDGDLQPQHSGERFCVSSRPPVPLHSQIWLVTLGLIACIGVLDGAHFVIGVNAQGRGELTTLALYRTVIFWALDAALVPIVFFLAKRYPLALKPSRVISHVIGALAYTYIHVALVVLVPYPFVAIQAVEFQPRFFEFLLHVFSIDFMTYWGILGVRYTIEYVVAWRQRETAVVILEKDLVEAHLVALRAQLNPHLFFNALNTISALALNGKHESIVEVVGRLGDLLRTSMDAKRPQQIPLASEMAYLDNYVAIQKLLLGDRLTIRKIIAPEMLSALVPCMILQPIVENAIVHGIFEHRGSGCVTIEANRDHGNLRLLVSDDGAGVGQIVTSRRSARGIGLANTEERLQLLYKNKHRVEYGIRPEGGVSVTISIPFRTEELPSLAREQEETQHLS